MSISTKITSAIALMGVLLTLSVYFLQRQLVYTEFQQLEEEYAKLNINRVMGRFNVALSTIDSTVYDWSAWDDTYTFAQSRNQSYIDSNLYPETFINFGTDIILFIDTDMSVLWAAVYEFFPDHEYEEVTEHYLDYLVSLAATFSVQIDYELPASEQYYKGLMVLGDTPAMFSMRPIHRSQGDSRAQGLLLMGMTLTDTLLDNFSDQISIDFDIGPVLTHSDLANKPSYQIERLSDDRLRISHPFMAGQTGGTLVYSNIGRTITQIGTQTINRVMLAFLLIGFFITLLAWLVLQRSVVRPIEHLKSKVTDIARFQDYSRRIDANRDDEIGHLSRAFNVLLKTVNKSTADLEHLNHQLNHEHEQLLSTQEELKKTNWELKSLSEKDALTGLYNRMAMERKLKREWGFLSRLNQPLSVLLIDIDRFKEYNDQYGHVAGDDCLRRVSIVFSSVAQRSSDMIARYGGEEFIMILPGIDLEEAKNLAEQLRTSVESEGIVHDHSDHHGILTVSLGIATAFPSPDVSILSLIKTADAALYQAKRNGRNCVESSVTSAHH